MNYCCRPPSTTQIQGRSISKYLLVECTKSRRAWWCKGGGGSRHIPPLKKFHVVKKTHGGGGSLPKEGFQLLSVENKFYGDLSKKQSSLSVSIIQNF